MYQETKEFDGLGTVNFAKIDNRKLSTIYRKIIGLVLSSGLSLNSDVGSILTQLGGKDIDEIRDVFFRHMSIENIGNLKDNYDKLIDEHGIFIELPLFISAFEVYLGKQLKQALNKKSTVFAALKNQFPMLNNLNLEELNGSFGDLLSEKLPTMKK